MFSRRLKQILSVVRAPLALLSEFKNFLAGTRFADLHLREAEIVGGFGSWRYDLETGKLFWSFGFYALLEADCTSHTPSFDFFNSLLIEKDRARRIALLDKIKSGEVTSYDETYRIRLPSGVQKDLRSKGSLVFDVNSSHRVFVGTTRDVTAVAEAAEAKYLSDRHLALLEGVKATTVTCKHEINNPLAVAMIAIDLALEGDSSRELLQTVSSSLTQISHVVMRLDEISETENIQLVSYVPNSSSQMLKLKNS